MYASQMITSHAPRMPSFYSPGTASDNINCSWRTFCALLMMQWKKLKQFELEQTGRSRHRIALLMQQKYGMAHELAENYLRNFERTLPLA